MKKGKQNNKQDQPKWENPLAKLDWDNDDSLPEMTPEELEASEKEWQPIMERAFRIEAELDRRPRKFKIEKGEYTEEKPYDL